MVSLLVLMIIAVKQTSPNLGVQNRAHGFCGSGISKGHIGVAPLYLGPHPEDSTVGKGDVT